MMLFKKYHVLPMYIGIKTYTRRFWKYPRRVGSIHKCVHDYSGFSFGELVIEDIYRQPLGMMTESDAYKEGGYTLKEYKITLEMITKKPWDDASVPWVVKFRFTPSDTIDPNGGTRDIDEYKLLYYKHKGEINGIQHGVSLFKLWGDNPGKL